MSEMIERVSRAIYSDDDPEAWDEALRMAAKYPETMAHYQQDIDETRAKARRAIEAMRDPTAAMIEAEPDGDGEFDKTNSVAHAKAFWQAMIDEALALPSQQGKST
jgi:hypothetical protein